MNPHGVTHWILSPARLPVPPLSHVININLFHSQIEQKLRRESDYELTDLICKKTNRRNSCDTDDKDAYK